MFYNKQFRQCQPRSLLNCHEHDLKIKLLSHFGTGNHKIPPKASVFFLNIKIDMQGKKKNHEAIP